MTTVMLDDFVEESIPEDVHKCFQCGAKVPDHVVACWNCGEILDKNIRRLMKTR